jgi:hypothetical protein
MVVCLVLLGACERQGQPQLWRVPKVGARGSGFLQFTANIQGPDGAPHTIKNLNEFTSETLVLDGDFPTRMRMTIVRHESALDGVAKPGITGTFEMDTTGDTVEVTRAGGTLTPEEREFFKSSKPPPSRASTAASKRFLQQSFKVGQVHTLTADEITGIGFGMTSVELTVTDVNATQVMFKIKTTGDMSGLNATMNAAGTLRMFQGGRELAQDGEILRDGKRIGDLHIEQRSRAL